jgi:DNA-binding transcriptional LysR family regulator
MATSTVKSRRIEVAVYMRVTIAVGLARHVLPALAQLAHEHPRLELDVRLEDRYADLVAEDLDLAVRGGALEDSTLIARQLTAVVYVLSAAPAYLKRKGVPSSPSDLPEHDWIFHQQSPRQLTGRHRGRRFRVELRGRFRADSGPGVLELLRAGAGLALTPLWEVIDDLRAGKLHVVMPEHEIKRSAVFALSPAGRQRLPKVTVATVRLATVLAHSGWDRIDPRWVASRKTGLR